MGKARADAAEELPLPLKKKSIAIHRMTHVSGQWAGTTDVEKYSISIWDSLKPQHMWMSKKEQAGKESAKGEIAGSLSKLVTSNHLNVCLPHQQPLAFPMVPTAQLSSLNVKTTSVCSHLGSVMAITTVAMAPTKNCTCAVRGMGWSEGEQCCLAKPPWFFCGACGPGGSCTIFEYWTHDLLPCDFS